MYHFNIKGMVSARGGSLIIREREKERKRGGGMGDNIVKIFNVLFKLK